MLDELHIRNLGVIEDAAVALDPGLTVLTGETGAGKTMVVTALQLLIGGRGDSALVRSGAGEALVEARWIPMPPGVARWLAGDDTASDGSDDDEAVVSRRVRDNGRSRVRINGQLATVGALADVVGPQVEVHAQDSHRRLLEPATQRRLLDAWAGPEHGQAVTAHAAAHAEHRRALARRDELVATATQRVRDVEQLQREIGEIDAAEIGEHDHDIEARIDELTHADDLRTGLGTAARAVGVEGAGEGLGQAVDAMRRLPTATAATEELHGRLDEVVALATDLAEDLRMAAEAIDADPEALDRAQARLATLRGLGRKYGPELEDIVTYRDEAAIRLEKLQALDEDAAAVDEAVATTRQAMEATAAVVTAGRREAARRLEVTVGEHLADLGLEHAEFTVSVTPGPMTSHGADDVTYLLAANPGQDAVELAGAASGGERSRVALALEVALADVTDAEVLVFDEVDAGIGGATAMKVGEKLATLARSGRQVMCVTHLAQLAAWADRHFVVDKVVAEGTTRTHVAPVGSHDRVAELARMLGGDTTEAARAHAAELLAEAGTTSDRHD